MELRTGVSFGSLFYSERSSMDEKLETILAKIDASQLSDEDKEAMYDLIAFGLQTTVWPVLMKYLTKEDIDAASKDGKLTVESYTGLIKKAVEGTEALDDVEKAMDQMLVSINAELAKSGIK
ncbi:hypothetical protein A2Z33_03570 [Candidatus Gottesmanbacteria bacterium RBG_16_52_11]|uniref:Uncharacterized protein n=1 Tax=Candidatus Gottesmanbacteria bacterium RBG_16_52_11 TaxID=1798374 RepID=A0A1F5YVR2_9BACT|nr:MAG: hypothetical protein A2Z33_03570 [Candidatus Gottesmanbacteria bacterium RBG_16_52_11]